MKLRTSFFNPRVLWKNLTRFAPLWILYAVGEVLCLLLLHNGGEAGRLANELKYVLGPVSIFHMVYALLVAACLFGDLFDSRMCYGLHAMPMRREGWLLTNLAGGAAFALIPAVVGGALAAVLLQEHAWVALVWQGIGLLQFLFFFGLAVFSALCAGKRLGMVAMYVLLNFLSMLVFWLASLFYQPLLEGVLLSQDWFLRLCPVVSFSTHMYLDINYDKILGLFFWGYFTDEWTYLWICAGVGVVFLVLAWLLYRKRHLETAGDFISFRPMRWFFLLAYTLTAGALLYSIADELGSYRGYGFLAVGLLIGHITGWMLLERTVKVFNRKVILSTAVFAVVFAGSMGLTKLDPAGVTQYIPQAEEVEFACLYPFNQHYTYINEDSIKGWYISEPQEIDQVRDLHRQMLQNTEDHDKEYTSIYVRYRLKNGRDVYRCYSVPTETRVAEDLKVFLSDMRAVMGVNDWEQARDSVQWIMVYDYNKNMGVEEIRTPDQVQALLTAIEADCEAGKMAQDNQFYPNREEFLGTIEIIWEITREKTQNNGEIISEQNAYITIYRDCTNTLAFLESLD